MTVIDGILLGIIIGAFGFALLCILQDHLSRIKPMANINDLNTALNAATVAVTDLQAKAANLDTSVDLTAQVATVNQLAANITTVANSLPQKPAPAPETPPAE